MTNHWVDAVLLFCVAAVSVGAENIFANHIDIAHHTFATFGDDVFNIALGLFSAWWARGYLYSVRVL